MKHLWVVRDDGSWRGTEYLLFTGKPVWNEKDEDWGENCPDVVSKGMLSFKLKPGGGPVKVKLVEVADV